MTGARFHDALMILSDEIVLASSSPRRKEILERLGFMVEIRYPDTDEKCLSGESPVDFAFRAAREKALFVAHQISSESKGSSPWIVGADTVVVLDDHPLGKPTDEDHARQMLEALSGREHQVLTGWVVINKDKGIEKGGVESTRVWFKKLRRHEIEAYLTTGEGADKAGSYGIQGVGCFMVERIDGNYENVVGLPACPLIEALQSLDLLPGFLASNTSGSPLGSSS